MQEPATEVPDKIWTLAEHAHVRSQIEEMLLAGNHTSAIKVVQKEGEAVVTELNTQRHFTKGRPYAFQGLVTASKDLSEDEWYLHDLQQLYIALIDTFGAPIQIDTT